MGHPFDYMKSCTDCELRKNANQVVVGDGYLNARVMLVGEAPGKQEDLTGVGFVGRSGQKLWEVLGWQGLTREDFFVCNIVKCRPPGNADPTPLQVSACKKHLTYQIKYIRPQIIVPVGAFALKWFMGASAPQSPKPAVSYSRSPATSLSL